MNVTDDALRTSDCSPCRTPTERRHMRRYQIELGASFLLYFALLLFSGFTVDRAVGALRIADAVLPVVGFTAMLVAIVRFVMSTDELQRQTFLAAGSIAALGTALVTMLVGFLENAGMPRPSYFFVWPLIAALFAAALPITRRRLR